MSGAPTGTLEDDRPLEPEVPVPERRARRTVSGALVIAAFVLVISILVWADHYQPLSQFNGGLYGSRVLTSQGTVAVHHYDDNLNGQNVGGTVWNEPANWYTVQGIFTINNDGSFPVTIDSVSNEWPQSYNSHFKTYFDSKGKLDGYYQYKGGANFTPTSIPAHEDLTLAVHWIARCIPGSGEVTGFPTIPVNYSFMGFHHTVTVPFAGFAVTYRSSC